MTTVALVRTRLRQTVSFHENIALVAWWAAHLERAGAWITPGRRRQALSLLSLVFLVTSVTRKSTGAGPDLTLAPGLRALLLVPYVLGFLSLCYLGAVHFRRLPEVIRRRPQIVLHLFFWSMLVTLWLTPGSDGLWRALFAQFALILPFLLWRCGYLLKSGQRGKAANTSLADHLFYLWPVWRGSETPYGKGFDYLTRSEAQSTEALARSQLAGLKLLLLAQVWRGVMLLMRGAVYGDAKTPLAGMLHGHSLGMPWLQDLIRGTATASLLTAWVSVYCDLIWNTLKLAVKGHEYIGVLRLCGFNVFRNTYKPLLSESIVEFWNRYYYYFKELMVEFFFYPVFARYKTQPWLRTLLAIFAAAFVGNLYYHVIQQEKLLVVGNFSELWNLLHARIFYCFLLATGIYVSMLREQGRRGQPAGARGGVTRRLLRIGGVWTFYGLIHIWGVGSGQATFGQRTRFLLSLFALG